MSVKKYYTLESIINSVENSKNNFYKNPYLNSSEDSEELMMIIDSYLSCFMTELIRADSKYLDLEELENFRGETKEKNDKAKKGGK